MLFKSLEIFAPVSGVIDVIRSGPRALWIEFTPHEECIIFAPVTGRILSIFDLDNLLGIEILQADIEETIRVVVRFDSVQNDGTPVQEKFNIREGCSVRRGQPISRFLSSVQRVFIDGHSLPGTLTRLADISERVFGGNTLLVHASYDWISEAIPIDRRIFWLLAVIMFLSPVLIVLLFF